MKNSAEAGDADAQYILGEKYEKGDWGLNDVEEATKWYRKSAEQYRKSAEQGDADAQFNLGRLYYYGKGVKEDHITAYALWKIANANDNKFARERTMNLGFYLTPEQVSKNFTRRWSKRIRS